MKLLLHFGKTTDLDKIRFQEKNEKEVEFPVDFHGHNCLAESVYFVKK